MGLERKLVAACFLGFVGIALYVLYEILWASPERKRVKLRRQGIKGPPPSLFYGNIPEMKRIQMEDKTRKVPGHDYAAILFPYFDRWRKEYGYVFMYSTGNMVSLYVSDLDMVRDIGQYKSLDLGKPSLLQIEYRALFGNGIVASNGSTWAYQRKVIAPEFFMKNVKDMVQLMLEATKPMLESWESRMQCEGGTADITIDQDLRNMSADVISRACFGSSYLEGKNIFVKLRALQMAISKKSLLIGIPGSRYLPTKNNREIWRLEREVRSLILKVVKERQEESGASSRKDLLQSLLESGGDGYVGPDTVEGFIVDNCKNIYFAGHETTALAASWCLMLLASYPEWQARCRDEVVEILGDQLPTADMLTKMKTLTMVIQESLRLYSPAFFTSRETLQDVKLGDIHIPKGVTLRVPISRLQNDPEVWGSDAHEFNPERFTHGIAGACKVPHAYIPFGTGIRTCVGQNFATVEMKVVLSLILSKFTFSLSPRYCHSPAFRLTLEPEFGVPLILKKV